MMARLHNQSKRRNEWRKQWVKSEHVHTYDPSQFGGPPRTPSGITLAFTATAGAAAATPTDPSPHTAVGAPSRWLRDPASRTQREAFMGREPSPPPVPIPPDPRTNKTRALDEYIDAFYKPKLKKQRGRRRGGDEGEDPFGEAVPKVAEVDKEERVEEEGGRLSGRPFKYTATPVKTRKRKKVGKAKRWPQSRSPGQQTREPPPSPLPSFPPNDTLSKHAPGRYLSGEVRAHEAEYLEHAAMDPREVQIDVMLSSAGGGGEGARVVPRSKARRRVRRQIGRAVTVLGRYWRGAVVRWTLFRQAEAALLLQTQVRRKLGANELARRRKPHDCARSIQAGWRYHVHRAAINAKLRAEYFAWRQRRDYEATRIQTVLRRRKDARRARAVRQQRDEKRAATVLQRRQRGAEGRRVAARHRAGHSALVKMQARCRQKQVGPLVAARRVEVAARREAAVRVQCSVRGRFATSEAARRRQRREQEKARQRERAAVRIQTPTRRKKAQAVVREKRQQRDASTLLQSAARRKTARGVVQERREQKNAAVKLQTIARSRSSVRIVDSKRQERREKEGAATKVV